MLLLNETKNGQSLGSVLSSFRQLRFDHFSTSLRRLMSCWASREWWSLIFAASRLCFSVYERKAVRVNNSTRRVSQFPQLVQSVPASQNRESSHDLSLAYWHDLTWMICFCGSLSVTGTLCVFAILRSTRWADFGQFCLPGSTWKQCQSWFNAVEGSPNPIPVPNTDLADWRAREHQLHSCRQEKST